MGASVRLLVAIEQRFQARSVRRPSASGHAIGMHPGMQQGMMMNAQNCPCMNHTAKPDGGAMMSKDGQMNCSGAGVPARDGHDHGTSHTGE